MSPAIKGIMVVSAGWCLSLALGSLFIWLPIAVELLRPLSAGGPHAWSIRQVSIPCAVAVASFVLAMAVGGRIQDIVGPRWPSTVGGVLIGFGSILASMTPARLSGPEDPAAFTLVGLCMAGVGAGLTFASIVPPAVKWTDPGHSGLIAGLVAAGFASGPAWANGRVLALVREYGVSEVLLVQGICLLGVVVGLSQLLEDPLVGYVAPGTYYENEGPLGGPLPWSGLTPWQALTTPAFRALWASGAILAATTSLLTIRLSLALMANPPGKDLLVIGFALSGGVGGVVAGALHDRFGGAGLPGVFAVVAAALGASALLSATGYVAAAAFFAASSGVGAVLVSWVSTMECFGTRNAGGTFGLVFTGWAFGVLMGAVIAAFAWGGAPDVAASVAGRIVTAVGFVAALGVSVALAARVRRPVTPGPATDMRRPPRGSVAG